MHRTPVHFEIVADDPERLSRFYTDLFGWKFQKAQIPGIENYWLIETAPPGQGVNGGMMRRMDPQQRGVNYIQVESVDEFARKVESLGGRIVMSRTEVPGEGWFVVALDPQENPFGLWEHKTPPSPPKTQKPKAKKAARPKKSARSKTKAARKGKRRG